MKNRSLLFILVTLVMITGNPVAGQSKRQKVNDTTYMLTYDHGGLILWGSDHFMERLRNAMEWLDKYKSFKIGLDNEAYVYDYLGENEPELMDELKSDLQKYSGRFAIGSSTYGQPLSQFINDESNVRQIAYALEAEKKYFNYRPPVYLMSEHAMHSQIPQILDGFGYKGAIMRTHFMMYGYNPTFDLPVGLWTGVDGSQIPAIPTYVGEGSEFGKTTIDTWILTRYPSKESPDPMEYFRKKFSHIHPLLASRADDSGLRKEELVREYEKKPKFKWILLDELLEKYPEAKDPMVTRPNDFVVRMPWGYCGNEIWNNSRKAEVSVLTAERLAAIEMLAGGDSHEADLGKAWKSLLLAQHHDIQICGLLADAGRLLPESTGESEKVISGSMNYFAGKMTGEGHGQITVFNPLSWDRTCWITADIDISRGMAKGYVAKCGTTEVPVRIISPEAYTDGSNILVKGVFKAKLSPLSISSWSVLPSDRAFSEDKPGIKTDENGMTVSTPYYKIVLAEEGGLTSIRDIKTGKLITGGNDRAAFFEGTIAGKDRLSSGRWIIRKSTPESPMVSMTECGSIGGIPYEFDMTFYEDNPRIDCRVKFDFNGQMIGLLSEDRRDSHSPFVHEEKLRFKLFPAIDTSAATGIRDLPFIIAETGNKYVEGNYWTAISDGNSGIAYFNKGNMGSVREKDGGFSIPLAYSMYYIWGTRILFGPYSYEFAILPFSGDRETTDLHRKALEYSFISPAIRTVPGDGSLGSSYNKVDTDAGGDVIMTALYPDKGKVVARFFKSGDSEATSALSVKIGSSRLSETRLDGTFIKDFSGPVLLKPWEIKTFRTK
jgi:alpha-mannosidase